MITNEEIKSLLKDLRAIENNTEFSVDQYAEIYEGIDSAMKCLDEKKKEIKKVLTANMVTGQVIPIHKKKREVLLHEGRENIVYSIQGIHKDLSTEGLGNYFYDIVKLVQSNVKKIDDDSAIEAVQEVVDRNSMRATGNPYITIQKLKG